MQIAGGFNVKLNIVPSADYWNVWTEVPLGITIWAHRPMGNMILTLGYTVDADGKPAAWNESHWVDKEFNDLLAEANATFDIAKRREIFCQLEDIQIDARDRGHRFLGEAVAHHPQEVPGRVLPSLHLRHLQRSLARS